ncbi:ribosome biogenesis GTPase YlqF [Granulosicoccaceae sp. 1_MG-2023]|nr:ribosome biogenesis GTPase YlqF [Granulosicoccaceae sp. 1_MG-2023]
MQIQWFPGHMHKARKEMAKVLPGVDVIIEVLDARIPYSSENPMLAELRGDKPVLRLLNKADLADPALTQIWVSELEVDSGSRALPTRMDDPACLKQITAICRELAPHREDDFRPVRTMITGIPNVGKSTLINKLAGRTIAKTGNEPAVTKTQQTIRLEDGIALLDTPGVLWPNVENPNSGYRLAMTGAIRDTALDHADVAYFAAAWFRDHHPDLLCGRYELESLPDEELAILEAIGRRRGCLGGGGLVDLDKVAKVILTDYRSGNLGALTLESPQDKAQELQLVEQRRIEKELKKQQRAEQRKKKKR